MPSEAAGGAEEHLAVLGVAFPVQAEQCELVALIGFRRGALVVAVHEVLDVDLERRGDAGEVACDLSGASGFPLGDGAAGDADAIGEFVLG